tara:strand:+ start:192 stop:794 length:603 start_codon:yes stop_codon:yes gene_type:complete
MSFSIFNEVIIDASRNFANVGIITAQDFRKADGSSLGSLTVKELASQSGTVNVEVANVTELQFNNATGFNVIDEGNGVAFIDLGSTFNPWYVDGSEPLHATGEEPIEIVAGPGIEITTTPSIQAGINTSKALTISASGSGQSAALADDDISGGYIITNPKILDSSVTLPGGSNGAVYGPEVTIAESTVITVDENASLLIT